MTTNTRKTLRNLSDALIILGVILVALSGDTWSFTDIGFTAYLVLVAKLFVPGWIGILIKIDLWIMLRYRVYQYQQYLEIKAQEEFEKQRRNELFEHICKVTNLSRRG